MSCIKIDKPFAHDQDLLLSQTAGQPMRSVEKPQSYNILNVFFRIQVEQVFYHHQVQVSLYTFVYLGRAKTSEN